MKMTLARLCAWIFATGLLLQVSALAQTDAPSVAPPAEAANGVDCAARKTCFAPVPADAAPVEKWMYECMDKPVPSLDFVGDVPLLEVLETIEAYVTKTYGRTEAGQFTFRVVPDKSELSLAGIDSLEDITVSDTHFGDISLRSQLDLIFAQTLDDSRAPAPLTYLIKDEVFLVTTRDKASRPESAYTVVYDVGSLLPQFSQFEVPTVADIATVSPSPVWGGFGAAPQKTGLGAERTARQVAVRPCGVARTDLPSLVALMTQNANSDNWAPPYGHGTAGRIALTVGTGHYMIVHQTPVMQRQIADFLCTLQCAKPMPKTD